MMTLRSLMHRISYLLLAAGAVVMAKALPAQTVNLNTGRAAFVMPDAPAVTVMMMRGITRSDQLPGNLETARKRLVRKQHVSNADLRALADHGDGNAAFQFAKKIDFEARPELAADAAHYYGIAASTGRGGAIYGFIRAVDKINPEHASEARLHLLRKTLLAYARAGSGPATEAMLRYYVAGEPFGDLGPELDALVVQTDGPAADAVALQLASQILHSGQGTPGALADAKRYLDKAANGESLRMRMIAENLLPVVEEKLAAFPQNVAAIPQDETEEEILQ